MTMNRIELMAATMAELSNDEAAAILRRMVDTVSWVADQPEGIHELTVAQEFHIASSKFERPRRVYEEIYAQAWDDNHVRAYLMVTPELDGTPDNPEDRHRAVRRHMERLQAQRDTEVFLQRTNHIARRITESETTK